MARAKKKTVKKKVTKRKVTKKKVTPKKEKKKVSLVVKCKLKQCLNCEKGVCEPGPITILKKVTPNTIKCPYFDDDFDKSWEAFKKAGGVLGAILRSKGKKTEEELKEAKKSMRKPRKDKGKKRGKKKNGK